MSGDDEPRPLREISKPEINALPLVSWEGEVRLLEDAGAMADAVRELAGERLLGFDTETRPTFKRGQYYPPALVQLATGSTVYLFRICCIGSLGPVKTLLESGDITKCGVAIRDDVKELRAFDDFEPAGFVEIAEQARQAGIRQSGLRPLAAMLLGGRISKGAQVTNWAAKTLNEKQIRYAATDAWVSREIYLKIRPPDEAL